MPGDNGKLLVIEDDPFLKEWIERLRDEHFPDVGITNISSEREFLLKRTQLARSGFKGIIVDLMLPWEDGVEMDAEDFREPRGEYFDAGVRILGDISRTPGLAEIAILVHTVNDKSAVALPRTNKLAINFVRKDEPDYLLIRWVNRNVF